MTVTPDARGRRPVLVVDGDASLRHSLARFLRFRGFDVVTAGTAAEARAAVLGHRPSAAVVELDLPDGTGRDVVVLIPSRIPVIMFTSDARASAELERLRPRTRFVAKPYSLLLLIEALEEMLSVAESLPQRQATGVGFGSDVLY